MLAEEFQQSPPFFLPSATLMTSTKDQEKR